MGKRKIYWVFLLFICLASVWFAAPKEASAKTGRGPCGSNASWKYDTKTKQLDLFGHGVVKKAVHIKKRMNLKRKGFDVKKLVIHEGITSVENHIFKNVLLFSGEVSLPRSFQKIPAGMFKELGSVERLFIPENVSVVEEPAFWGCHLLREVSVSQRNRRYRSVDGALYTKDMSKLVYYPQAKENAFYNIPGSVVEIAPLAFAKNVYLKRVKIPVGLQELGGGAFYGCISLESVNISELYKLIRIKDFQSDFSFSYGRMAATVGQRHESGEPGYNGALGVEEGFCQDTTEKYGSLGTFAYTHLSSFSMPDSLRYIASETFRGSAIEKFTIGRNFIGGINFGREFAQKSVNLYYLDLRRLSLSSGNKKYTLEGNILYTKDKKILCQAVSDKRYRKDTLVIKKKTRKIARGAFRNISIYKNIVVEGDLDRIGVSAFAYSKIQSFRVKGAVREVGMGAFMWSRVQRWEYGGGLTRIPANTFAYSYLKRFDFHSEVKGIGNEAFTGAYRMEEVSETDSVKKLGHYVFHGCNLLAELEFVNLESAGIDVCGIHTKLIVPETAAVSFPFNGHESKLRDWIAGRIIFIPSGETAGKCQEAASLFLLGLSYAPFMLQMCLQL